MLRTCDDCCVAAKTLLEDYRTQLTEASSTLTGDALAERLYQINADIDSKAEMTLSFNHALAIQLDQFYRKVIGEDYTKADLMIYLNQQKNHTQDEYGVMLIYPNVIEQAHDSIHLYYCQDMA